MSGVFEGDKVEDAQAILRFANLVATLWNENGGPDFGFEIRVGENEVKRCCNEARHVLVESGMFPIPPGPFKRVAALIVCARLFNFFDFVPKPVSAQERDAWQARIVALLIPVGLSVLEVNVSKTEGVQRWVKLDKWKGFVSHHYKIEFLAFLQWLEICDWANQSMGQNEWRLFRTKRLARMVLATTLILEANYYAGEYQMPADSLRKIYKPYGSKQDLTVFSYDAVLYRNAAAKRGLSP